MKIANDRILCMITHIVICILSISKAQNIAIMPSIGPLEGLTVLKIYGTTITNQNYSTYPTPKCRFSVDGSVSLASWIHCIPYQILQSMYLGDAKADPQATVTCLTCMTPPSKKEANYSVDVSLKGDFSDKLTTQFSYYINPTINYITPILGQMAGGTFVQVYGQNFKNVGFQLQCAFGTIYTPATFVSSTLITCTSPSSDVTDAAMPFKVTQNLQQNTDSRISFYYYPFPEISELIPNKGPNTGGTLVFIKGKMLYPFKVSQIDISNFTTVKFGDIYISDVTLINNTHASVISPPSYLDIPVPVELTFNQQEWTADGILFYYYNPPYVFQLIPDSGTVKGGTNVTVIGANFYPSENPTCKFNSSVTKAYYIDTNHFWCITPAASQAGYAYFGLAIETDQYSGNNLQYLYIEPPVISSVNPICGPASGFTQLTIIGKNFIATGPNKAFCIFNGNIYQIATVMNSTLIYCDSPSILDKFGNNYNNISSYSLGLTLNNIDILNYSQPFTYYTLPVITSIIPNSGPVSGQTTVIVNGFDFSSNCGITGRFGTMPSPCQYINSTAINCTVPQTSCPDDTAVQVSLNGQQYTSNDNSNLNTLYSYYRPPIVSYISPSISPNTGSTVTTIYGRGFLYGRSDSTGYNDSQPVNYFCQFSDPRGNVINVSSALYVDDTSIDCSTPPVSNINTPISISISTNGQNWFPVTNTTLSYYQAPVVTSVNPQFGPIQAKGTYLAVNGNGFQCLDSQCSSIFCAFSTKNSRIVTQGTLVNSTQISCQIPPVSRPDVTIVSITLNGNDFTTQPVTYTFFDAFVLSFDPSIIPVEGGTLVNINGYGFANTQMLQVRLGDPNNPISCAGSTQTCILNATYVNENLMTFVMPPQANLNYISGPNVGFDPLEVEVSVYGGTYTDNNLTLQYYVQPQVGQMTPSGAPFTFHVNSGLSAIVPVTLNIPPNTTPDSFMKKIQPACQYNQGSETYTVSGTLLDYPLPNGNTNYGIAISCPTPPFKNSGQGNISISINGNNFIGNQAINVKPSLAIASISPACGPVIGGTTVQIQTQGFDQTSDMGNLFFIWGTQCTPPLGYSTFQSDNNFLLNAPPAPNGNSNGGLAMVILGNGYNTQMSDASNASNVLPHLYSRNDFLYYIPPMIQAVTPHSALYTGGSQVMIQGAYFLNDPIHGCTPKCRFGNMTVEATFISSVQLQCTTPPYSIGLNIPLEVSMNDVDYTNSGTLFNFYAEPVINDINPKSGPSSGGTTIYITGQNFVDLSRYPNEFQCVFRSLNLNIPVKMTPAYYRNDTTILCSSPGGWGAGNLASVEITYNGIQTTNSNSTFRFYQVDKVLPMSGPASGDGNAITIIGSGFLNAPGINCKIDGVISNATFVNWTTIQCPIPPSKNGPGFFGMVDFFYSLNGMEYNMVVNGFSYYQQPVVSSILPNVIPVSGGLIIVNGQGFRSDFYGAVLTCKLADTVIPAILINDTQIQCNFPRLNYINTVSNPIQNIGVALNNLSYTMPNDNTLVSIFDVASISPTSGVTEGGTLVSVKGYGFVPGTVPSCRFGVPGASLITYGTVITSEDVTCKSPEVPLPKNGNIPFHLPFSISFSDPSFDGYSKSAVHFRYFIQPQIIDINPKSGPADQYIVVTVTSDSTKSFGHALVGGLEGMEGNFITENILCDFGTFGTTSGTYINMTTIQCITPVSKIPLNQISIQSTTFGLAINGQDYIISTKSTESYGYLWIIAIIIASLLIFGMCYLLSKLFTQTAIENENQLQRLPNEPRNAEPLGLGNQLGYPEPGFNARVGGVNNQDSRPRPNLNVG